ncbi:hypothetical protein DID76_02570 [Candidatus Marinamargulisbacteria bacterium SCGC AG-414-C22]|nr:hypothetical protein DID76_02570 [Candidatus Marinamargulisbacteria bacterium SCGC AG-414-C22]
MPFGIRSIGNSKVHPTSINTSTASTSTPTPATKTTKSAITRFNHYVGNKLIKTIQSNIEKKNE